jgi:hypothetical protein
MNIRERIGQLTAWKVFLVVILALMIALLAVEKIFISKVFNLIDHTIDRFELVFKNENKEIDDDYKNFNEEEEYNRARSEINAMYIKEWMGDPKQVYVCSIQRRVSKMRKLLELPYVQHRQYITENWNHEITSYQIWINKYVDEGLFDPEKCMDVQS